VDGVYLQARMELQAECMLVLIGATPEGKKELLGFQVGLRESTQSWRELLVDLKACGLVIAPKLATGDGALGFWKALDEVSPTTGHQRCTVHKAANVLDNQCPRQDAQVRPASSQTRPARGLGGAQPCDGRGGGRDVCREVWGVNGGQKARKSGDGQKVGTNLAVASAAFRRSTINGQVLGGRPLSTPSAAEGGGRRPALIGVCHQQF